MSKKIEESASEEFFKKSKDGEMEGLFQCSSSSSLRHKALISVVKTEVQTENP
jgi:hypothetical protein